MILPAFSLCARQARLVQPHLNNRIASGTGIPAAIASSDRDYMEAIGTVLIGLLHDLCL